MVTKVAGHMLQCSVKKVRDNYCRLLIQLTGRHLMYKKINDLRRDRGTMPEADFLIRLNKWDKEVVELMAATENDAGRSRLTTSTGPQ